ncbi:Uncharacterized protein APZ42_026318 [Daphnia magna]|uniref:Uncharacterized protein n=1 Tax=Daphnia magna TaxID=35525 RepID=A0A164SBY3_9CRUS|nr:Uncharacterized protein APZ42_026318 [Daphnia magna]
MEPIKPFGARLVCVVLPFLHTSVLETKPIRSPIILPSGSERRVF